MHHHHYFHGGGGAWGGNGWGGWGWAGVAAPLGYAAGRAYAVPGYGGYGGYYGGTDTVPQVNVNNASGATSSDDSDSDDDDDDDGDTDAQGTGDDDDEDDDSDDADSSTPKDDADGRGAPPVDYEAPLPKDRGAIHIKLPDPSAAITFDGESILGRGPDRLILTPSIQAGKPFKYQVQATWTQNGQTVTELREGTVVAGKYAIANFDAPANAAPTARTSQATSATQPGTK